MLIIGLYLLAMLAHAGVAMSARDALRYRTEADPHGLIADMRQQLDKLGGSAAPAQERDLLWLMGTAAVNVNDDTALTEALLRLDSLAAARHYDLAAASAGFLRSRHLIASGNGDGISEALRAAAKVQDATDPKIIAWAKYNLCDAYAMSERASGAMPLCEQAQDAYRALGDTWSLAEAENDQGVNFAGLNQPEKAIELYQRSRQHFASLGAEQMVAMVGDNLAQMYLKVGRAKEALLLSQASLAQEQATGRISDALVSRANIALDYATLGQSARALSTISAAVDDARAAKMDGLLPELLERRSRMSEQAGQPRQALDDAREVIRLLGERNATTLHSDEVSLEARYATRENELRIQTLEHQNRLQELALKTAQAEAAEHVESQQRQALVGMLTKGVSVALILIAGLLYLLLRAQRRYAAELRVQALRDPLTGVDNRRAFMQRATALLGDDHAPRLTHVLMLIDFDHFKRVNDSAGHPQGDRVLSMVADYLSCAIVDVGHIARIGGEEFAVLCPRLGADAGLRLAETLRAGVAALSLPAAVPLDHITISIGVALFDGDRCHDLGSWMRAADAALYSAKSFGRNRVVASSLLH
ncbi:GGDEF domain-containing protein [Rhodanobacter panaciterrae]|nr:GGDEF domain-containing protein [Rhodanobacter panaciterrae]